jgi:hypothetical protein
MNSGVGGAADLPPGPPRTAPSAPLTSAQRCTLRTMDGIRHRSGHSNDTADGDRAGQPGSRGGAPRGAPVLTGPGTSAARPATVSRRYLRNCFVARRHRMAQLMASNSWPMRCGASPRGGIPPDAAAAIAADWLGVRRRKQRHSPTRTRVCRFSGRPTPWMRQRGLSIINFQVATTPRGGGKRWSGESLHTCSASLFNAQWPDIPACRLARVYPAKFQFVATWRCGPGDRWERS